MLASHAAKRLNQDASRALQVLDDQNLWLRQWITLLTAIAQDPVSQSMLIVSSSCYQAGHACLSYSWVPTPQAFGCCWCRLMP